VHIEPEISGFQRHIRACNNAILPGGRLPFTIGAEQVGWVKPALAQVLAAFPQVTTRPDGVRLNDPAAMQTIVRGLAEQGILRWRGEAFDVRACPDGQAIAEIDRGALPAFGIEAVGVHVNGLVDRADGPHLWIARRAAHKALDPGKLDHLVAGGVPAGLTAEETLVKEAAEEAGIAAELARQSIHVGVIRYVMAREEGLRRDLLQCYDLTLPETFRPYPRDGEVAAFELWPLPRVAEAVRTTEMFKFNVNLVLIDLFLRRGLFRADDAVKLRAAL
jgi:8-oxo-dGTP pyrophosphatase MutT (NUDIX family)